MRRALVELSLVLLAVICIHTVTIMRSGSIHLRVYPAHFGESVMAINGTDSVRAMSRDGYFGMKVRPGTWKVIVANKELTRNVIRENLLVNRGENINLGEIRLSE
ncbi:MAG: hypothetical protein ACHQET_01585 [Chitinophagales bacterium]